MAVPDPTEVAPWYLRNINQALELDSTTGNVFVRTGLASGGNIIITGNVTIPGEIDTHITAIGTLGNITTPYMPIGGNVIVSSGNITAVVSGTVAVSGISSNVTVVDGGGSITVDGSVNANITGGNVNAVVTGNVTTPTDITQADSTYEMNVARGLVTGQYAVLRSGYNPDCTQSVLESIWVEGGIYPFTSWTAAGKLYVISTSVSDTGQSI